MGFADWRIDRIEAGTGEDMACAREIGERGVVDLTLPASGVRIFPALEGGLGRARSCSLVTVEI